MHNHTGPNSGLQHGLWACAGRTVRGNRPRFDDSDRNAAAADTHRDWEPA